MSHSGAPPIPAVSRWIAIVVAVILAAAGLAVAAPPERAEAAGLPSSILEGGYIISDAEFFDSDSMTRAQIQAFLKARVSTCSSGATCLKSYKANIAKRSADKYCKALSAAKGVSAATIIYRVARACGINPKVIIVMLQKEQGLVTSTAPSKARYSSAMGFNCPDTTGCSTTSLGFFTQVYGGARQLQVYTKNPNSFNYHAGQVNTIKWHPNSSCGTSKVYIQNQATANLYIYTPYRPNVAALAAGTGTGDSCSSYGNRNFYNYYVSWFAKSVSDSSGAPAQVPACQSPPKADIASASGTATVELSGSVTTLNVRKAPTLKCTSGLTSLKDGAKVTITGRYGMWTRIKKGGATRWVATAYLSVSGAAPAGSSSPCTAPSSASITAASGTVKVTLPDSLEGLNARKAPSTACSTGKLTLSDGAKYARTGTYGVWWRITVKGTAYWAHSDYLTVVSSSASTASTTSTTKASTTKVGRIVKVTAPVNLRTGASTAKKSLTVLKTGTKAMVIGSSGSWRKVVVGSRVGWAHSDYLKATSTVKTVKKRTVTAPVNLRTGASTAKKSLAVLKTGRKVLVFGSSGKWRHVVVGSRVGWVYSSYLE
ncbi:MAG: SH3 domain-containing protein [Microbacterium sp.]